MKLWGIIIAANEREHLDYVFNFALADYCVEFLIFLEGKNKGGFPLKTTNAIIPVKHVNNVNTHL